MITGRTFTFSQYMHINVENKYMHNNDLEQIYAEQTADHIISQCPIHRAPRGMFGLMVLDDETRCWLKSLTVSI